MGKQFDLDTRLLLNSEDFKAGLEGAKDKAKSFRKSVKNDVDSTSDSFFNLKNVIKGGIFLEVIGKAKEFAGAIIEARSEYEKYAAILTNSLGSARMSAQAMSMLTQFAQETPFELNQLTDAYVKMVNRGLIPSKTELKKVGDFASSTGKDMNQLTEAILDINNQERWKEFGVRVETVGDKVKLSFKGQTFEVERTTQAVFEAIQKFGEMKGVSGTMSAQMETLGGKTSNFKDAWNQMLVALGNNSIWGKVIAAATTLVNRLTDLFKGAKQISNELATQSVGNVIDSTKGKSKDETFKILTDRISFVKQKRSELGEENKKLLKEVNGFSNIITLGGKGMIDGSTKKYNANLTLLNSYTSEKDQLEKILKDPDWYNKLYPTQTKEIAAGKDKKSKKKYTPDDMQDDPEDVYNKTVSKLGLGKKPDRLKSLDAKSVSSSFSNNKPELQIIDFDAEKRTEDLINLKNATEDLVGANLSMSDSFETVRKHSGRMAASLTAVAGAMQDAAINGASSMKELAAAGLNAARSIVAQQIAIGVSAAVKSALIDVPYPFNLIASASAGAVATTLFNSIIPKFANGGVVPGTSYSGDNVLAAVNSKEVILNTPQQSKLFDIINNGVGGGGLEIEHRIKGTDLVLLINNVNKKQSRIR